MSGSEVDLTPFPVFNFFVTFDVDDFDSGTGDFVFLCSGVFSECTGLDATMEPKVIKEGGRNYGANQRVGPVTFSTVILKRGMTATKDLWKWWSLIAGGKYAYRLKVTIEIYQYDNTTPAATFVLDKALPVKFKAPDLNAQGGSSVAIEEIHLAHEGLRRSF